MSQRSGDFERALGRLRSEYRAELPARLDALESELKEARESGSDDTLREARRHTHTLKGTSGSYGLGGVSQALEAIEQRLDALLAGEGDPRTVWREIEGTLARARSSLDGSQT